MILTLGCLAGPALAAPGETELTGDLVVMQACDFDHHSAETLYMLQDDSTGKMLHLRLGKNIATRDLKTGSKVRVKGLVDETDVTLSEDGPGIQTVEASAVAVTGQQKTICIIVNFNNAINECSASQVSNIMFPATNSVNGLYQETSFGAVWFTGTVVGPYTINYSSTGSCDYNNWASSADAAATTAGANLSLYTHKVYVLPKKNPCDWAGLGTVGGSSGRAWIGICDLADVYSHELGHNLGMNHSSTDTNNDGNAECEYCDNSDLMGYAGPGLRQINAPHRTQMGWTDSAKVEEVSSDTTLNLAPLELAATNTAYPQIMKISRPNSSGYYYFSYRRGIGYDSVLNVKYLNQVTVHHYNEDGDNTYFVKTLSDGGSFSDSTSGMTVIQTAHNNNFATVQVFFGCNPAPLTVSTAKTSANPKAGGVATYSVSVLNNDTLVCGSSSLQLTPDVPVGWTATVSTASYIINPGQTRQSTMTVKVPVGTPEGVYPVSIGVNDVAQSLHVTNINTTCIVLPGPVPPPPPVTPTGLTALGGKKRVILTWTGSTNVVKGTQYQVYRDGAYIALSKKTTYVDKKATVGISHDYYVVTVNIMGVTSAPSETASATPVLAVPKVK